MKTRTLVLALSIGAVIAAIAVAVAKWPKLPARTLPKPPTHVPVPMTGETLAHVSQGCLAPMVAELQKRPNWTLRIDDMRWTDYGEDPHHATIVLDAKGASWRSAWIPTQTLDLTDAERRDVLAAFALSCEVDESLPRNGYEGRYIAVAYDRQGPPAAKLDYNSPVVVRLGELFEAIRARYVANRAAASKVFVMKLKGLRRTGPKEWTPYELVIDSKDADTTDQNRVDTVDWALALPSTLPKGKLTALGTFTLEGVTKPVAVNLDHNAPENVVMNQLHPLTAELLIWMTINFEKKD